MPKGLKNYPHAFDTPTDEGELEPEIVEALHGGPATFESLAAALGLQSAAGRSTLRRELGTAVARMRVHYHHRPTGIRRRWKWPAARVYSLSPELDAGGIVVRCVACAAIYSPPAQRARTAPQPPRHRGRVRRGALSPADELLVDAVRRLGDGTAGQVAVRLYGDRKRAARVRTDLRDLVERGRLHVRVEGGRILFTVHADGCHACAARAEARRKRFGRLRAGDVLAALASGPLTVAELEAATGLAGHAVMEAVRDARDAGSVRFVQVERGEDIVAGYQLAEEVTA